MNCVLAADLRVLDWETMVASSAAGKRASWNASSSEADCLDERDDAEDERRRGGFFERENEGGSGIESVGSGS